MDYTVLLQSPLFRGLSGEEIDKLMDVLPHQQKRFRKGVLIAQSGEQVTSLMVLMSGIVKGEMVDFTGRVIKIEDIHTPGAIASAFLFGKRNNFPVNVIATTPVEMIVIDKPEFLKLLKMNDTILVNFLDMISNRSQFLSEKIKFLNFKTIKEKLSQFILQKLQNDKSELILEMTQSDLADFFGVARPSVARALGEMEDEGLLEARGKIIRVFDKRKIGGMPVRKTD